MDFDANYFTIGSTFINPLYECQNKKLSKQKSHPHVEFAANLILPRQLVPHISLVKLNKESHPHVDFAENVDYTCIIVLTLFRNEYLAMPI